MKFCKGFAVISAAVLLAFGAEAQEKDIFTLEETAITATRTEIAVEDAPASVSVVTQEEIKSLGATTLDEVLRHEAGVILRRDKGIAMATPRVSLRGLGGDSRTLVMLDGMPLNDGYSSGVTWTQLGIENVERIEITRGPGSALYGGNALGGVINIITKKPSGREIKATVGAGSDNTRKYSASYGDMFTDKFGMRIGFEHEKSDGYPATTTRRSITTTQPSTDELTGGYPGKSASGSDTYIVGDAGDNWGERNNVNLQSYFTPDASSMITFNAQWGRHEYGYDRPHTYLTDANGNPSYSGYVDLGNGRYASVSPNNFIYYMGNGDEEYTSLALMYDKEFENIVLNAKVGYSYKTKWYTTAGSSGTYDNAAGSLTDSDLYTWYTDVQLSGNIGQKHKLTGGMTYRTNDFEQAGYSLSFYRDEDSKTSKNEITEGKDQYYGVYIQDEWTLPASFTLFTGIRYDYWSASDGKAGQIGSEETFSEPHDDAFSPKVALVWNPIEDTVLRTSYGTAFRAPNIYDMYRSWRSGTTNYHSNPNLKPEKLESWEIGADQFFFNKKLKVSATYYNSEIKDAIERTNSGSDRYTDNVGKASIDGFELALEAQPVKGLKLWANGSWVNSEVLENKNKPEIEGKELTDVPDVMYNVGGIYKWRFLSIALDGNYQGRIYTSDMNDDINGVYASYDERWIWNTRITAEVGKHVEVSGAVTNIFDKEYFDYYVGRERSYMLELTAKF